MVAKEFMLYLYLGIPGRRYKRMRKANQHEKLSETRFNWKRLAMGENVRYDPN